MGVVGGVCHVLVFTWSGFQRRQITRETVVLGHIVCDHFGSVVSACGLCETQLLFGLTKGDSTFHWVCILKMGPPTQWFNCKLWIHLNNGQLEFTADLQGIQQKLRFYHAPNLLRPVLNSYSLSFWPHPHIPTGNWQDIAPLVLIIIITIIMGCVCANRRCSHLQSPLSHFWVIIFTLWWFKLLQNWSLFTAKTVKHLMCNVYGVVPQVDCRQKLTSGPRERAGENHHLCGSTAEFIGFV